MVKLGSLFDGIGGALLCAEMCGAEPVWASEIEPFPVKVTKHRFPSVKHYGDITQMNGAEIEPVDIIVGGSPCQDLSVAGKRAGLKGERSGLFMDMVRIIKEMRESTNNEYPRYMVWENVPGAFSSNEGKDFQAVLEETAKITDPTISIPGSPEWSNAGSILGDGFSISWRTIDAQYWGVPQRRRRIYLVADFRGQTAPEILFEREGESWHIAQSKRAGQGTAEGTEDRSIEVTASFKGSAGAGASIGYAEELSPTLMADGPISHVYSMQCSDEYIKNNKARTQAERQHKSATDLVAEQQGIRRLTPLECERLQGFPDGWTDMGSDTARYKALGNSFAIPCALFVIQGCVEQMRGKQHDFTIR